VKKRELEDRIDVLKTEPVTGPVKPPVSDLIGSTDSTAGSTGSTISRII